MWREMVEWYLSFIGTGIVLFAFFLVLTWPMGLRLGEGRPRKTLLTSDVSILAWSLIAFGHFLLMLSLRPPDWLGPSIGWLASVIILTSLVAVRPELTRWRAIRLLVFAELMATPVMDFLAVVYNGWLEIPGIVVYTWAIANVNIVLYLLTFVTLRRRFHSSQRTGSDDANALMPS